MKKYTLLLSVFLFSASICSAQTFRANMPEVMPIENADNVQLFKSYRGYVKVPAQNITVPTILEVDFNANSISGNSFGVYNETTKLFVPSVFISKEQVGPKIIGIQNVATGENLYDLYDNNFSTKKDFYVTPAKNSVEFLVQYDSLLKSTSLVLSLDKNVTLPDYITIQAQVGNAFVTVLNRVRPGTGALNFPETNSKTWRILAEYSQSLRVSEISFSNNSNVISKKSVRFLASPANSYIVYANQDEVLQNYANYQESGNLYSSSGVKNVGLLVLSSNPLFVPADTDKDGVLDSVDNCKIHPNGDQKDENNNGVGDVCDDFDQDMIMNSIDNCPNVANYNQKDTDGDKVGDTCDPDESRLTEKYPVIVWFGIGFAGLVLLGLLFLAGNKIRKNKDTMPPQTPNVPPAIN